MAREELQLRELIFIFVSVWNWKEKLERSQQRRGRLQQTLPLDKDGGSV